MDRAVIMFILLMLSTNVAAITQVDTTGGLSTERASYLNFPDAFIAYGAHGATPYKKRTADGAKSALMRLISVAKQVYGGGPVRNNFKLVGDTKKALDDFYSFNPVKITKRNRLGVLTLTGWAGDRYLSLRARGLRGDPILDVINMKRKDDGHSRYIDRFIYKKSIDN